MDGNGAPVVSGGAGFPRGDRALPRRHAISGHLVSARPVYLSRTASRTDRHYPPALFAMSAALSKLWAHWGVTPEAVVGHSMGEVAAAYTAGALSLSDAATVICRRSALMKRVNGQGSMALVEMPEDVLRQHLATYKGRLSVAASNSASSTVLSGETTAMQHLLAELERGQVFCRFIKVDVASHSAYVDPIREELLDAIESIRPGRASIPMYSTVTGDAEWGPGLDRHYWVRNLREPVMFGRAIQQLIRDGFGTFLEISPHPLLTPSVRGRLGRGGTKVWLLLRSRGTRTRDHRYWQARLACTLLASP